jgi:hypothetical protein
MFNHVHSSHELSQTPPVYQKWVGEANVIAGAIATRCGGDSSAASHCTAPGYDSPKVPTRPFDHGWAAAHSMVS